MKTKLTINYVKYFQLYHIGIFYVAVIVYNIFIGGVAECEGIPALQHAIHLDEFKSVDEHQQHEANLRYDSYIAEKMRKNNNSVLNSVLPQTESKLPILPDTSQVNTSQVNPSQVNQSVLEPIVPISEILNTDHIQKIISKENYDKLIQIQELDIKYYYDKTNMRLKNQIRELLPAINSNANYYTDIIAKINGSGESDMIQLDKVAQYTKNDKIQHYVASYYYNCVIYTYIKYNQMPDLDLASKVYEEMMRTYNQ